MVSTINLYLSLSLSLYCVDVFCCHGTSVCYPPFTKSKLDQTRYLETPSWRDSYRLVKLLLIAVMIGIIAMTVKVSPCRCVVLVVVRVFFRHTCIFFVKWRQEKERERERERERKGKIEIEREGEREREACNTGWKISCYSTRCTCTCKLSPGCKIVFWLWLSSFSRAPNQLNHRNKNMTTHTHIHLS